MSPGEVLDAAGQGLAQKISSGDAQRQFLHNADKHAFDAFHLSRV